MIRVAAIVEGYGDVQAVPSLIAKTSNLLGSPAVASDPIRAGEWKLLRRPGIIETYLELAASRQWDLILVVLDLEDDCAVEEAALARERIEDWKDGRDLKVELVFMVREYETLFLWCPTCLPISSNMALPVDPDAVRGAKERVKQVTGRRYKETQDQLRYTQSIDIPVLYGTSRSFRRFCKALSGVDYDILDLMI